MYKYALVDEKGFAVDVIEMPVVLNHRTQFEHETGTYEVFDLEKVHGKVAFGCRRVTKDIWLTGHIQKSAELKMKLSSWG